MNEQDGLRQVVPSFLPARMVNEFVYCPRLFYFEWVERRWADNDDTTLGSVHHESAGRGGGQMPDPDDPAPPERTFTVRLESERLGLSAIIDRVDHGDGSTTPVEYKKGAGPRDGGMWPADQAQLWAHAALLEEVGYTVTKVDVSYGANHQRVSVAWDGAARDELNSIVEQARAVAQQPVPPRPLVDSPKCPRCSLLGICMPDEVNTMLERVERPRRTIVPRDGDATPLYVSEQGAYVSARGGRIVVRKDDTTLADVRLIDVSQLVLVGHCQASTEALTRLMRHEVPIVWLSYGGWLNGWSQGRPTQNANLRRKQALGDRPDVAARIVAGKIMNQRTLLRRNGERRDDDTFETLKELATKAGRARSIPSLLGLEGTAARMYFSKFSTMLRSDDVFAATFHMNGRRRRPAPDPVNALLGFVYGLLVKDLTTVCLVAGLDPYLGVMHADRFGRPAMALDLAEEFRPLIGDSVVLQVLNNREVTDTDFLSVRGSGTVLTKDGRRTVIRAYERRLEHSIRHPRFGYKVTYRRVLEVQARLMAAVLVGELDEYEPMVTR